MSDNVIQFDDHKYDFAGMEFHCFCTNRTFIIFGDGTAKCAGCGEFATEDGEELKGLWHTPPDMQVEEVQPGDDEGYKTVRNISTNPHANKARVLQILEEPGLRFVVFGFEGERVLSIFYENFDTQERIKWLWRRLRVAWRDMAESKP